MSVRLEPKNPLTTADSLITIEGVPGYFSTFSGVQISFSRPQYSDGLSAVKRSAASGTKEVSDVTVSRAFDPESADDVALLAWVREYEGGEAFNLTVRPVKRTAGIEFRGNRAWYLSGCRIKTWSTFENIDTGSGEGVVMVSLTFTVEDAVFS